MPKEYTLRSKSKLRELIDAEAIINKLQADICWDSEADPDYKPMNPTQISAAKTLLNKVLPDLKAMELTGDPENPINTNLLVEFIGDITE